jgi:hypothetical protein
MMSTAMVLYCCGCRDDRELEPPPCADGSRHRLPRPGVRRVRLAIFAFANGEDAANRRRRVRPVSRVA